MNLIRPKHMPPFPGLKVPKDLYFVIDSPAFLAGMAYPSWSPRWMEMQHAGLRHVVCLTHDRFRYDPTPLNPLHAIALEDLFGGLTPRDPQNEKQRIYRAAAIALRSLKKREGVAIHCAGGAGRTGTVIGCILRSLGYSSKEVLDYLDELHKARGQDGWPESSWQASIVEGFRP